ncbi:hypothetical protein [Microcoleus sp. FACHB-672]|uniref:hypothetical protein n=1 Tax=Microcoleus sp. FACHB-672 TaxID=2692825 RepID=UPI00168931DB|nr:hypothetical protein [Microcoleus sp. FACHB-672]MBD2039252.1 hypothetical protein [Microcoleus sp. FACHB-672]
MTQQWNIPVYRFLSSLPDPQPAIVSKGQFDCSLIVNSLSSDAFHLPSFVSQAERKPLVVTSTTCRHGHYCLLQYWSVSGGCGKHPTGRKPFYSSYVAFKELAD